MALSLTRLGMATNKITFLKAKYDDDEDKNRERNQNWEGNKTLAQFNLKTQLDRDLVRDD